MGAEEITIRACESHAEFDACVAIQRAAWQFEDLDLVPKEIFIIAAKTGGQVFGAFAGGRQVGFVMAFLAVRRERVFLHSHMLAVDPGHRDRGIGRRLKLRQREDALGRGIDLIEWTFDPLALKNAHLNVNRLGAVVRQYVRNQYGRTSSPLHAGAPTDRLVAEWQLRSPRVEAIVATEAIVAGKAEAGAAADSEIENREICIPREIDQLRQKDSARTEAVLSRAREEFERSFSEGYAVTGFRFDGTNGVYLLSHHED